MNDPEGGRPKRRTITDQEALQFHAQGRPGKLEVIPTKPMATQRDLSLAYSPGVAVPVKAIAEAHGRGLGVPVVSLPPEEAESHFGWLAPFAKIDMPSSSVLTRQKLNWHPTGPGLIADLDDMDYSQT